MLTERLQEGISQFAKPALGYGAPPNGESLEHHLREGSLSQDQITAVLESTGHDLAQIHAGQGEKFGWINPLRTVITRQFVGKYDNWYAFLLAFYDEQTQALDKIFAQERETGRYHAPLSEKNRAALMELHSQRPLVKGIFEEKEKLLSSVTPQRLHGNVYIGSIYVGADGRYAGLGDFSQMLLGDPLDDIAYFSVMPQGSERYPILQQAWKDATGEIDPEEKIRLYRLWEAERKIGTRYANHKYLDQYPEPLAIASEEIKNFI